MGLWKYTWANVSSIVLFAVQSGRRLPLCPYSVMDSTWMWPLRRYHTDYFGEDSWIRPQPMQFISMPRSYRVSKEVKLQPPDGDRTKRKGAQEPVAATSHIHGSKRYIPRPYGMEKLVDVAVDFPPLEKI